MTDGMSRALPAHRLFGRSVCLFAAGRTVRLPLPRPRRILVTHEGWPIRVTREPAS